MLRHLWWSWPVCFTGSSSFGWQIKRCVPDHVLLLWFLPLPAGGPTWLVTVTSLNSFNMSEYWSFWTSAHSLDTAERLYEAGTVRKVSASINRLRPTSTNSPKYLKKSAPIGLVTSAIVNVHVNDMANPRSNCTDISPNVRIEDPLAACSCIPHDAFRRSPRQGGKTLISEPVSMRYSQLRYRIGNCEQATSRYSQVGCRF